MLTTKTIKRKKKAKVNANTVFIAHFKKDHVVSMVHVYLYIAIHMLRI